MRWPEWVGTPFELMLTSVTESKTTTLGGDEKDLEKTKQGKRVYLHGAYNFARLGDLE